jgi:predicted transposase YbfD/YdcC
MQYSTIPFELKLPEKALVFDADSLYARLMELEDKRKCRGRLYELAPLLFIAILAKLMGQNELEAVAHWAKLRTAQLCQLLGLRRQQMPHKTTWGRVLAGVEVSQLEKLSREFFEDAQPSEIPERGSVIINLDGKTLRGTIPAGKTQGVHLLAAYLPRLGVVLAQVEVGQKENEIVAAPKIIEQLDLRGLVVTGDAMHTQKALSVKIVTGGGDWLWFAKHNKETLRTDLEILFGPAPVTAFDREVPPDFRSYREVSKAHGRLEIREITLSSQLKDFTPWPHLEQAFKLEKRVYSLSGKEKYCEVRYGITSLPAEVASPKRVLQIARGAWGIENKLHWRRDVLLREDWSQLRRGGAPQVNAVLNNLTLGVLALAGYSNVAQARRELTYHSDKAVGLLTTSLSST